MLLLQRLKAFLTRYSACGDLLACELFAVD